MNSTLTELAEEAHEIAVEKGWWDKKPERFVAEQLLNMSAEISEAWEEYRVNPDLTYVWYQVDGKPEGFGVELADVIIRIFDTCMKYEIPLEALIKEKMAYNRTRPYRHGNKLA